MIQFLAIANGAFLGFLTASYARGIGRREPRFWALVLVVMQILYVVFALRVPDLSGLVREGVVLAVFTAIAVAGSRFSSWFLALGLFAHGVWDLRHLLAREDYVVGLYPELCVGYDWLVFFYVLIFAGAIDRARRPPTAQEAVQ